MTNKELEALVDRATEIAARNNSPEEQTYWEFNREGIRAAIVLHLAVMEACKSIPITGN